MANWSKRRTQTFKSSKNRITRTTNTSGSATYSQSKRVGNTRTTTSTTHKNGIAKTKVMTTEWNPVLGRRVTTKTLNPTTHTPKPSKARKTSRKKANTAIYTGSSNGAESAIGYIFAALVVGIPSVLILLALFGKFLGTAVILGLIAWLIWFFS